MNTSTGYETSGDNITQNERTFRVTLGLGMLVAILVGAVAPVTNIVVLTMLSVYLVMTAILGVDPLYTMIERLSERQRKGTFQNSERVHA